MKHIYKIMVFSFVLAMAFFTIPDAVAQSKAKVENVTFFIENESLIITYDIVKAATGELFDVNVNIATTSGKKISAYSLQGDIGPGVYAGKYKRITWDLKKDNVYLDDEIVVEVNAVPMSQTKNISVGGALLRSAIFPGWGNRYAKGGGAYWIMGIMAYGAAGGAFYFNNEAYNALEDYKKATTAGDRDRLFTDAEDQKSMQNNLMIAAGAVWAIDLIWTGIQAGSAKKNADASKVTAGCYFDPVAGQPMFRIAYHLN